MQLNFTKMHGLGNDFVVLDATAGPLSLSPEQIRFIADRHKGVGCDQLLLVEPASREDVDFRYRIFNADGGEVAQCGNGARCFARYVRDKGLTDKDNIVVETSSGVITIYLEADGQVRVNMGVPNFVPSSLPFSVSERRPMYAIDLAGETVSVGAVSMGNPHVVIVVDDISQAPVERLGSLLEAHSLFPERVNAGFAEYVDRTHVRVRVYERGVGETLACGTGACAAMAVGRARNVLDEEVVVTLPGGDLVIRWQGEGEDLWMIGPATTVFEGTINL